MFRAPGRRAVTMIELLIVVAVIAVLAGLIVVSIQNAREAANRTRCANNLHQVGVAYTSYVDTRGGKPAAFKADVTWTGALLPYLENNTQVFSCTSPTAPTAVSKPSRGLDLAIYSHVLGEKISLTPSETIDIVESKFPEEWRIASYRIETDWGNIPERYKPGPDGYWLMVVASRWRDDYKAARGWPNFPQRYRLFVMVDPKPNGTVQINLSPMTDWYRTADPKIIEPVGYVLPASIPSTNVIVVETKRGPDDANWGDSPNNPGRDDPDTYDLIRESTGQVLIADITNPNNAAFQRPRPSYTVRGGIGLQVLSPLPCDYGVNSKAGYFSHAGDSGKVLALEYTKVVAKVAGTDTTDLVQWPKLAAVRHNGVMNVLFKGGHVMAMLRNEIDPGYSQIQKQFWLPQRLQR